MALLGARRAGSWELGKPGTDLGAGSAGWGSCSSVSAGGAEHKVGEEMFDKTNAPNQLHTGLVLLSRVQPLHNAVVGQLHFLPFSQLFSELFSLMSSDIYSWCSLCHLCVFRAFYSKISQHLEGRRAGNKTGNLCCVGFIEIKNPSCLLWEF